MKLKEHDLHFSRDFRTSHWLNPHEDTSLPSALEMPKIPSDKTSAAKELPKPMKLRNYAV